MIILCGIEQIKDNVPIKDLDHLGYLIAGQKVLNVFEDREKQYLNCEGIYFEQIFSKLKEAFKNEYEVAPQGYNVG